MHPEVKYIGFLMLLYAGTTSIFSFKYSLIISIVKKLKQWSKSAGNINVILFKFKLEQYMNNGTSETLRGETIINTEQIKLVSVHVPKHLKPLNDEEFGHYLAGLIDGDGHFSNNLQLVIVFNKLDVSLAYYIKGELGYGNVKKVKDKNAFILVIFSINGIYKTLNLINGKLRTINKLSQVNNNIINHKRFLNLKSDIKFELNLNNSLNNHWLAGFSDADASFQIKLVVRDNKTETRLNYQVDQKNKDLLVEIKNFFGGNIGYREKQDTYYYGSTSFGSAKKVISYFDKYHLLSSKHLNYLKWRKAYLIIQSKNHLNTEGLNKITKLKSTMNSLSVDSLR